MGVIVVKVQVQNGKLVQTPLSPAERAQIRNRRTTLAASNSALQIHLQDAFNRAQQRLDADPVEPLLVLKRPDDFLRFEVTGVTNFSVEVIPFPGDAVHPGGAPANTPNAFDGFSQGNPLQASNGAVLTGPPTQSAVQFVWRWHKYTVTSGNLVPLDPCIFVRD
jgi:hypothetical protein